MGYYETDSAAGDAHRIYSTDEETASWNFNELREGRWPEAEDEIVVDERFVRENGGTVRVGDSVPVLLKTAAHEYRKDALICGICACNEELDEARIYVSEAFLNKDLSGFGQTVSDGASHRLSSGRGVRLCAHAASGILYGDGGNL